MAIKLIKKNKLDEDAIEMIKQEVQILSSIDHPNIVKYYETYDDESKLYLVMEYINGGELFDKLQES